MLNLEKLLKSVLYAAGVIIGLLGAILGLMWLMLWQPALMFLVLLPGLFFGWLVCMIYRSLA